MHSALHNLVSRRRFSPSGDYSGGCVLWQGVGVARSRGLHAPTINPSEALLVLMGLFTYIRYTSSASVWAKVIVAQQSPLSLPATRRVKKDCSRFSFLILILELYFYPMSPIFSRTYCYYTRICRFCVVFQINSTQMYGNHELKNLVY
jgi:hypothetical protein